MEIVYAQVLYTGDFSRQEDRHLMTAELPNVRPDVLITVKNFLLLYFIDMVTVCSYIDSQLLTEILL